MPATAGGMRGGGETPGEVGASPAESADKFVFDTYMSLSRMGGGKVDYGVAKINRLREGLVRRALFCSLPLESKIPG